MTIAEVIIYLLSILFFILLGIVIGRTQGVDYFLANHTEHCIDKKYQHYDSCIKYLVKKGLEK